jgi:hypothetical protein
MLRAPSLLCWRIVAQVSAFVRRLASNRKPRGRILHLEWNLGRRTFLGGTRCHQLLLPISDNVTPVRFMSGPVCCSVSFAMPSYCLTGWPELVHEQCGMNKLDKLTLV